jgi:hypothetical protein
MGEVKASEDLALLIRHEAFVVLELQKGVLERWGWIGKISVRI